MIPRELQLCARQLVAIVLGADGPEAPLVDDRYSFPFISVSKTGPKTDVFGIAYPGDFAGCVLAAYRFIAWHASDTSIAQHSTTASLVLKALGPFDFVTVSHSARIITAGIGQRRVDYLTPANFNNTHEAIGLAAVDILNGFGIDIHAKINELAEAYGKAPCHEPALPLTTEQTERLGVALDLIIELAK